MTDPLPRTEFRHARFADVLAHGPGLADRVAGSPGLHRRQVAARQLCQALGRLRVLGLEHVPAAGPVILAVNHTSFMDGPLLFGLLRRPVSFLVKAEAFEPAGGLAGVVLRGAGQLPVRRSQVDPAPVRYALALLEAGGVLGMFPEGTRGRGLAHQVRPGVGYLAVRTGAPVLPVAVLGTAGMLRSAGRGPVSVRIGSPLRFARAAPGPLHRTRWLAAAEAVRRALVDQVRLGMAEQPAVEPGSPPPGSPAPRTTMGG
ncbi:MAG TPA: lysophospholipid acyltransferase family protein [Jatrophihabitans sp.]|nr:lysophospholipid acyltransferase family protein [Jatrophihabitans sp.]